MHFRPRGRVIQLVRTVYDPTTKKPKAQVVGSLVKAKPEITDELRLSCKPEELAEIKAYLQNQNHQERLELEMAALTLVAQMKKAGEWLSTSLSSPENEILGAEILREIPILRRKLHQRFGKADKDGAQ